MGHKEVSSQAKPPYHEPGIFDRVYGGISSIHPIHISAQIF